MPRFVILAHDHPDPHWDLMLEAGEALRTWRLSALPQPGLTVEASATFDHRLVYLDYEGPISGGRGCVVRWDRGTFAWEFRDEGKVVVRLEGGRLGGVLQLDAVVGDTWRARLVPA